MCIFSYVHIHHVHLLLYQVTSNTSYFPSWGGGGGEQSELGWPGECHLQALVYVVMKNVRLVCHSSLSVASRLQATSGSVSVLSWILYRNLPSNLFLSSFSTQDFLCVIMLRVPHAQSIYDKRSSVFCYVMHNRLVVSHCSVHPIISVVTDHFNIGFW
jgi:hypothetical protein